MRRHAIPFLLAAIVAAAAPGQTEAFRTDEAAALRNHVQLTFPARFLKAGESYFSPDDSKVIFQAVEAVPEGEQPEAFYQMYVSDVVRDESGRITGLENHRRLSPPGSSNTCGWFHPTRPGVVTFGSTIVPPTRPGRAGYQRDRRDYSWQFPKEMTIVQCDIATADGSAGSLEPIVTDDEAYLAECSFTKDGRNLIFCRYREDQAPAGGDLFVLDLESGRETTLIDAEGYDGGPFFSPDETRICYRSDRRGDNHLQIFVSELSRDDTGAINGIGLERQITNNQHVNWAPFWLPDGRHLVYTTSQEGHRNYEVFLIDTQPADPSMGFEVTKRRVTNAMGFDGLPAFNRDASVMIWTSQRDASGTSQLWAADFVVEFEDASP